MGIRNLLSSRAPCGRSTRPLCLCLFDTWTPLIQQVIHRRWRLILLALGASMVVSLASHARADGSAPSTEHSEDTISGAAEAKTMFPGPGSSMIRDLPTDRFSFSAAVVFTVIRDSYAKPCCG